MQRATTADIVLAVDQAFYNALGSQAVLKVAEQTVAARQETADQIGALAASKLKSSLDLSFANVNLAQLVDALYGINTLPMPIGVSNIRIQRRTQDTHSYDVDLTCVALAKNT